MATMGEMRVWAMNGTSTWREAEEKLREEMLLSIVLQRKISCEAMRIHVLP